MKEKQLHKELSDIICNNAIGINNSWMQYGLDERYKYELVVGKVSASEELVTPSKKWCRPREFHETSCHGCIMNTSILIKPPLQGPIAMNNKI
ncbi:hypothetical protein NPIL_219351 [Nephila pilipes]|uniref:Uncharacterized protein n=1 Tax=Nephila pilipes TaxID=299642 RepID=A0A8X6NYG3_NEPPI|nr:hypothetical protein NPIL_219351 [Nephila pilipes]